MSDEDRKREVGRAALATAMLVVCVSRNHCRWYETAEKMARDEGCSDIADAILLCHAAWHELIDTCEEVARHEVSGLAGKAQLDTVERGLKERLA